ncbi:MAG: poly-gamma-glutamate hydrolase family protein [Actinomycetota bacterium]
MKAHVDARRLRTASGRFAELLAQDNVDEVCELRSSRLGFMAYHGGQLEKVTDVIAATAAERSGMSYYGVLQSDEDNVVHLPSKIVDPADSAALASFVEHVDAVVTIHGYGRKRLWHALLLGGRNRPLAQHVARHLRRRLPDYDIIDDVGSIPKSLAGMHPQNPVNVPRDAGVQIELPATVRWNRKGRHWSDHGSQGRAPQVDALILGLVEAAQTWDQGSP